MRMSRAEAARNRARVVQGAAEAFRAGGYDGTGIAALMQGAGLTNGAFYKQFESKEALIAEATAAALAQTADAWQGVLDDAAAAGGDPLAALCEWYLSEAHLAHPEKGCAYATLAAEAPRHDGALRAVFEAGLARTLEQIGAQIGGADAAAPEAATEAAAMRELARMVGALMLARAVRDPALARRWLAANRAPEAPGGARGA